MFTFLERFADLMVVGLLGLDVKTNIITTIFQKY